MIIIPNRASGGNFEKEMIELARILLVDDRAIILSSIKDILEDAGHQAVTASDGGAALRQFACGEFDAVVTDWSMPSMDGEELAGLIKARSPATPVVLISAGDPPDSVKRAADGFAYKDNPQELLAVIKDLLDSRPTILVFDSDWRVTNVIREWLKRGGFRVCVAHTAEENWSKLRADSKICALVVGWRQSQRSAEHYAPAVTTVARESGRQTVPIILFLGDSQKMPEDMPGGVVFLQCHDPNDLSPFFEAIVEAMRE